MFVSINKNVTATNLGSSVHTFVPLLPLSVGQERDNLPPVYGSNLWLVLWLITPKFSW